MVATNDDETPRNGQVQRRVETSSQKYIWSAIYKIHMNPQIKCRKPEPLQNLIRVPTDAVQCLPACMTVSNWNDMWLRNWPLPADAAEELYPCLKLMYHRGKHIGSLIPCVVQADVVPALDKLFQPDTHQYCNISPCKPLAFPNSAVHGQPRFRLACS